jgi:exopolysaccharide biosynthesis protein
MINNARRSKIISAVTAVVVLMLILAAGAAAAVKNIAPPKPNIWSVDKTVVINKKKFRVKAVYVNPVGKNIKIKTALGGGYIGGTEELASMARRYGATAAINGTFFNAYSDMQPQGNIQINGRYLHFSNNGSTVGFTDANQMTISPIRPDIRGTVYTPGSVFTDWQGSGINHLYPDNARTVMIYTPEKGLKTPMKNATSIIIKKGLLDRVVEGVVYIPRDGYVISITKGHASDIYMKRFSPGTPVSYAVYFSDPANKPVDWSKNRNSVGAGPTLIKGGKIVANPVAEGMKDPKLTTNAGARSAIGKTASGQIILATVSSATIKQLAEVMKQMGAVEAMNLDGGASSSLYFKGSYLTKPGRKISNAILVFGQ